MSVNPNTIILVENDAQTVTLLNHIFCRKCINVVSISSSKIDQLDTLIENNQPRLIMLDYMSIRRNYDAICRVLSSFATPIPTALLTSISGDALSTSFDYVIKKPFYLSDISMILQDVVEKST